nr:unnamed protein product [Digitaria exilis]
MGETPNSTAGGGGGVVREAPVAAVKEEAAREALMASDQLEPVPCGIYAWAWLDLARRRSIVPGMVSSSAGHSPAAC